jgi:hypothetical protein
MWCCLQIQETGIGTGRRKAEEEEEEEEEEEFM